MGLKSFFSFIWNDFKSDVKFIKTFFFGKQEDKDKLAANAKRNVAGMWKALPEAMKEYWMWFFIVAFAFCLGIYIGSQYYQVKCNDIIMEVNEELREEYGIYVGVDKFKVRLNESNYGKLGIVSSLQNATIPDS